MIAFLYQDLNSQLHHRATNHKKSVSIVAISYVKSCRNVVRVKCVSDNGVRVKYVSENGAYVKYVSDNGVCVKCVSDNGQYPSHYKCL